MSSEFTQDVVFPMLFSHNCSMLVQSRLEITTPSGHLEHVTFEAMHCISNALTSATGLPTNQPMCKLVMSNVPTYFNLLEKLQGMQWAHTSPLSAEVHAECSISIY